MQEKLISLAIIAAFVVGVSFVLNWWEQHSVKSAIGETLSVHNAHTFGNRAGVEQALTDIAVKIVGEKAEPEIELYHYVGTVYAQDIDMDALPKYGGVEVVGSQVRLSALVARVWWYQKIVWYKQVDVSVTRAVFVDAGKLGYGYERPSSADFEFVDKPWMLLDSTQ